MRSLRTVAGTTRRLAAEVGTGWLLLGAASSTVLAVVSPALIRNFDGPWFSWWYDPVPSTPTAILWASVAGYGAVALLLVGWLAVGWRVRTGRVSTRALWLTGIAWVLPLAVGPPLFSRDMYGYIGQAALVNLHLNPYTHGVDALSGTASAGFVQAVSPPWRATPAPYGPLFVWLASLILKLAGRNLTAAVLLLRLPELAGVAVVAVLLPRLARRLGADPRLALWVGGLSPLVLFELVGGGHNDALLAAVLVLAVYLAVEHHALVPAAIVCGAAVTIKAPAAVACVVITAAALRAPGARPLRVVVVTAAGVAGAVAAITAATGLGYRWMSPSVLLTPAKGSIVLTPVTAVAGTVTDVGHLFGWNLGEGTVTTSVWLAGLAAAAAVAWVLLGRSRPENLVAPLGLITLLVVVSAPALWPWYLTWAFCFLAAVPVLQRSALLAAAAAGAGLVLAPSSEIVLPSADAPFVLAGWALVALLAVRAVRAFGSRAGLRAPAADPLAPVAGPTPAPALASTPGPRASG